ncbi:MAG: hypothetical protein ACR2NZ_21435 [Rubripirellula sp.]
MSPNPPSERQSKTRALAPPPAVEQADSEPTAIADVWQRRLGQRLMAVFCQADETRVGVLRLNGVQEVEGDPTSCKLFVSELQLSEDVPASNDLQWLDEVELETSQLLYFDLLSRELNVAEIPNYRKAIERLAIVARLLEMEANLD